jgi:hypothetical protein
VQFVSSSNVSKTDRGRPEPQAFDAELQVVRESPRPRKKVLRKKVKKRLYPLKPAPSPSFAAAWPASGAKKTLEFPRAVVQWLDI